MISAFKDIGKQVNFLKKLKYITLYPTMLLASLSEYREQFFDKYLYSTNSNYSRLILKFFFK